jgi:hypothetical protein
VVFAKATRRAGLMHAMLTNQLDNCKAPGHG